MRHLKKRNKLSRHSSHRNAVLINLCSSIIKNGRIRTTKAKAKMVQPVIEKIITRAKVNSLHNKRVIASRLGSWELIPRLFDQVGPKFVKRPGGYTRIIKIGFRNSDGAEMALIELLEEFKDVSAKKETDTKAKSSKPSDTPKTATKKAKKPSRGKKKEKPKKLKEKKKSAVTKEIKKKAVKKKTAKKKSVKKKSVKKKAEKKKAVKKRTASKKKSTGAKKKK